MSKIVRPKTPLDETIKIMKKITHFQKSWFLVIFILLLAVLTYSVLDWLSKSKTPQPEKPFVQVESTELP